MFHLWTREKRSIEWSKISLQHGKMGTAFDIITECTGCYWRNHLSKETHSEKQYTKLSVPFSFSYLILMLFDETKLEILTLAKAINTFYASEMCPQKRGSYFHNYKTQPAFNIYTSSAENMPKCCLACTYILYSQLSHSQVVLMILQCFYNL